MDTQNSGTTTDDTEIWKTLVSIALSEQQLTDAVIQLVTNCLLDLNFPQAHASNPRLCVLLLKIQRFDLFVALLEEGLNDLWLPLPKRIAGKWLDERAVRSFMSSQELCLDQNISIETFGLHFSLADVAETDFQCLELLGAGGFGEVHRVRDQRSGVTYARKTMTRPNRYLRQKEMLLNFRKEVLGMRRVRHQHCVELVASCTDMDSLMIFSSPVADLDLSKFLALKNLDSLQLRILENAVGCISSALAYLHGLHIRHDDLKPNNILVHGSNVLLTDFGFCLDSSDSGVTTTADRPAHQTLRYSAPEVFNHDPRSRLSDIWSLGCVLCDIVSRLHGFSPQEMTLWWKNTGTRMDSYSENLEATKSWFAVLVQKGYATKYVWLMRFIEQILLEKERLMRPTAAQVVKRLAEEELATWRAHCCNEPSGPGAMETYYGRPGIETSPSRWNLTILLDMHKHFACVFVNRSGVVIASSANMSSYPTLDSFMDATSARALRSIFPVAPRDGYRHLIEVADYDELVKSLHISTDKVYYSFSLTLRLASWQAACECPAAAIVTTRQLERRDLFGQPVFALVFDPEETFNIREGPSDRERRETARMLAYADGFPEPFHGDNDVWPNLDRFRLGGDGNVYCNDCARSYKDCCCRRFITQLAATDVKFLPPGSRQRTVTALVRAELDDGDKRQRLEMEWQTNHPFARQNHLSFAEAHPIVPDNNLLFSEPASVYERHNAINNILGTSFYGSDARPISMRDRGRIKIPETMQAPSFHSSSYRSKMEAAFLKDLTCCGLTHSSLHDLLQHFEEVHADPTPSRKGTPARNGVS